MSVPTNLIPTLITGLQEYTGSSTLGYMPYILDGRTYKVQFANIAAVGAVPSSRVIAAGTGLAGGGDLSANRVISIANGGVGFDQLALSGVTQGTYGSGSAIPILTVDSKGRITSATTAALDVTGFVPTSRTITAGDGLTGGGSLANNISLAANFSATTPSALGTASAGTANTVSRGDHVHPAVNLSDTTQTQGALPLGRGGTGDALSPVAGAVVYSTGTKFALSNPGLPGQVLSSNGTDEPQWTSVGAGTVISVGVATANGFAGTVTNPALSPVITLSTTVTGMLKGDGTAVSAATAGVDYVEPGAYVTSGLTMASARLLGRTTASVGAAEELTVGTGLTLSGGSLVNAAPDQVVALTGGTAISVTGTYPSFTITNTAPDQTVSLTAGTAISITGTYPSFSVTNTAPDQVVSLTGAGTTTVTGTYPSFTITSNDSTSGTVTSVNASGGTTGMSFTGGPITSAGTLTLNGTLAVANGGTGATDAVAALTNLGAYPASNPSGFTSNVGTVTSVSGTGTVSGLSLSGTVTSAGSLTLGGTLAVLPSNFASQTANTVLAAPNGSAGVPTFRAIVAADIPTLNQNTTGTASNVTGIVAVANGGTGASVAATARTNLSAAASGANTDITSIALTTGTISTSPVNGTDIVNKAYADSIASGINFHQSVRLATAAALPANTYNNGTSGVGATLTANANGALSVDGVAVAAGNRILVKNEAAGANNGVYVVTDTGSSGGPGPGPGGSNPYILTRATDFDSAGTGVDQIDAGDFFLVTAGSTLANTSWVQQTPLPITVGTTAIVFSQFAAPVLYSAGTGLSLTGTTFSITNTGVSASTYGSASSVPVIAVNAQGQVTSASASSIAIAASQITSGALAIANGGTGATSAATALTNLGAYPASNPSGFTSNTGTVTSVNLTAGTGVSVSGGPITASGSITVTNTAPDQVVSLTGSGATTVTGTYPNFTISSPTAGAGTVTSIDVSGGTTGLTTSGGPVTSSGTITLAGTLNVANGGTGATTLTSGYVLKGNGTSAVSASVVYDNGTNVGVGTTSPGARIETYQSSGGTNAIRMNTNFASGNYVDFNPSISGVSNGGFSIALNGTIRQVISYDGNVGVGTASPAGRFHALGPAGADVLYRLEPAYTYASKLLISSVSSGDGGIRYGTSNDLNVLTYSTMTFNTGAISGSLGTERLTINSSGNVTANVDMRAPIFYDSNNTAYYVDPASTGTAASLNGNTIIPGTKSYFTYTSDYGIGTPDFSGLQIFTSNGDVMRFGHRTGGATFTERMRLDTSGNLLVGTTTASYSASGRGVAVLGGSASGLLGFQIGGVAKGYVGHFDTSMQMWNEANSPILFGTNAAERMRIDGAGNVGINTTTPSEKIEAFGADASIIVHYSGQSRGGISALSGARIALTTTTSGDDLVFGYAGSPITSAGFVPRMTIDNGTGSITAGVDFRAPIFYDSNNTGFFIDPASTSSLITLLAQNLGVYDSGVTNDPYGKIAVTRATGANYSYYGLTRSGQHAMGMGIDTGNAFWIGGCSSGYDGVRTSTWLSMTTAGNVTAPVDMRAPIFYDSNNTAYYIDPNAGSNVFGDFRVNQNGAAGIQLLSTTGTQSLWIRTGYSGAPTPSVSATNVQFQSSGSSAGTFNFWSGNTLSLTIAGDYAEGAGSLRAPIFYDSNNTGYYLDPAGSSVLGIITAQSTNDAQLYLNGNGTSWAGIQWTDVSGSDNMWYNGSTSTFAIGGGGSVVANKKLHINGGTTIGSGIAASASGTNSLLVEASITANQLYAQIFYDSQNGAYYLDPASTGTSLNVAGNIIGVGELRTSGQITNANYMVGGSQNGAVNIGRIDTNYRWEGTIWGSTTTLGLLANCADYWEFGIHDSGSKVVSPLYYDGGARFLMGRDIGWGQTYIEAASSFRAPIFYDSNNTAYFCDPNSTSILATVRSDRIQFSNANEAVTLNNGSYLMLRDPTGRVAAYLGGADPGNYYDNTTHWFRDRAASNMAILNSSGMYAPTFYDFNDTGYYLDPNGTGLALKVAGNIECYARSAAWAEGVRVRVPTRATWGGIRFTRDEANSNGNWAIGFTGIDSTDDLTFWGNLSGGEGMRARLTQTGNFTATGNVTAYSDIRIKKDVATVTDALKLVGRMRGVTYTRKDTGEAGVGVIAQEMFEVMPQVVQRDGGAEGTLSVAYGNLVGVLIEAIKELEARVAELEGK